MKNLKIVTITIIFILFISCKKETKDTNEIVIGDTLSETDNDYIDSISVPNPELNEMIGLDGNPLGRQSGVLVSLNDLVKAMLIDAQNLSGQKNISHQDEGINKPQHMGFVYSYGQRDITKRLNPNSGNAIHKKYAVYGTDCSGFIINLFRHAGINISNCTVSSFESALKNALKNNPDSIKIENKGHLSVNEIKTGDIIFWLGTDLNHIGIISELTNGKRVVFQSNGTGTPIDETAQTKNLGIKRGVHAIDLTMAINGRGYWGNSYKILRLKTNDSTVQDIDGNIYHTIKIGTQTWLVENLKTTRYNDGVTIPNITNTTTWYEYGTGTVNGYPAVEKAAWCYYDNNVGNNTLHGKLYNWHAVKTGKLAPTGWHVPTKIEWETLINYLGGSSVAGGKMKITTLWNSPNIGASNSSGFSADPCGYRDNHGDFGGIGDFSGWWSSTQSTNNTNWAWNYYLENISANIITDEGSKTPGLAIRCIKN